MNKQYTRLLALLQVILISASPFMVHAEELIAPQLTEQKTESIKNELKRIQSEIPKVDQVIIKEIIENLEETDEEDSDLDLGNDSAESDAVKDFTGVVRQSKDYTCGPASLATLMTQLGNDTAEQEILDTITPENLNSEKGTNLLALKIASQKLGNITFLKRWSTTEILGYIKSSSDPVLMHDEKKGVGGHFSVIREYDDVNGIVELSDTEAGNIKYSVKDFEHIYTGEALVINDTNPEGKEITDEEAANIWGKYVPVYIAATAVDGADPKTTAAVNAFKSCIATAMKTTVLTTRNSQRSACYVTLGNALRVPLSAGEETALLAKVEVSKLTDDKTNEQSVGTADILYALRKALAAQINYNTENPTYLTLMSQGGVSIANLPAYRTQLAVFTNKISQYNSEITILNSSLAVKQKSYNDLNTKISSGNFEQNGVTYSLGAVGNQVTAASATYSKLSNALTAKLANLDSQIASLTRQVTSANSQVNTFVNQANTARSNANSALSNYNYYKTRRGYTSTANSFYNTYANELNKANTAESNANYYRNQISSYNSQISSLRNQKTFASTEVNNASSELAKQKKLKDFGDAEMQRLRGVLSTLKTDLDSMKTQLSSKQNTLDTYKSKNKTMIDSLTDKIAKLSSAQSYESKINKYKADIDAVKTRYGYISLSYTNTQETELLIVKELDFQKTQELSTEKSAVISTDQNISGFGYLVSFTNIIVSTTYNMVAETLYIVFNPIDSAKGLYHAVINIDALSKSAVEVASKNLIAFIQIDNNSFISVYNGANGFNDVAVTSATTLALAKGAVKGVQVARTSLTMSEVVTASEKTNAIVKLTTTLKNYAATKTTEITKAAIALFENANTVESMTAVATKFQLPNTGSANILIGATASAEGVVVRLNAMGWVENPTILKASDGSRVYNYIAPNGLQAINLRTYSSSTAELLSKGYVHQGTIDLMMLDRVGGNVINKIEVKFVLPK